MGGCSEFLKISRRSFLRGASAVSALGLSHLFAPRFSVAQTTGSGKTLVLVFLPGGLDILSAVIPNARIGTLRDIRPTIHLPEEQIWSFTNDFSLSSGLGPVRFLHENHRALHVAFGGGFPNHSRSHEQAQLQYSSLSDTFNMANPTGWAGRVKLDPVGNQLDTFSCWGFGWGQTDYIPNDQQPALMVGRLTDFDYHNGALPATEAERMRVYKKQLIEVREAVEPGDETYLATVRAIPESVARIRDVSSIAIQGTYGNSPFATRMQDAFRVAKYNRDHGKGGMNTIIMVGQGGFDTHVDQAKNDGLQKLLTAVFTGIAGFFQDVIAAGMFPEVTLVVASEFGRTLRENGNAGTDHGEAGGFFTMGGAVKGGVFGEVPSDAVLRGNTNWLEPTYDIRSVYKEVFTWMGLKNITSNIIPENFEATRIGVF